MLMTAAQRASELRCWQIQDLTIAAGIDVQDAPFRCLSTA
jgi:hypothetical protein